MIGGSKNHFVFFGFIRHRYVLFGGYNANNYEQIDIARVQNELYHSFLAFLWYFFLMKFSHPTQYFNRRSNDLWVTKNNACRHKDVHKRIFFLNFVPQRLNFESDVKPSIFVK